MASFDIRIAYRYAIHKAEVWLSIDQVLQARGPRKVLPDGFQGRHYPCPRQEASGPTHRSRCLQIFGLDDAMLGRATELVLAGIELKPFDQSILAGVLVRASRLWDAGERTISFCEIDGHLQPWDKYGNAKPPLRDAFDQAHVWVYGDFTLTQPTKREGFE